MVELSKTIKEKIEDIFSQEDVSYEIPLYQREYSWKEDQIDKFCENIFELEESEDNNYDYLLGSIILVKGKNKDIETYEVIDGQQRLTTISIFLTTLKFFVNEENKGEIDRRLKNEKNPSIRRLKTKDYFDEKFNSLLKMDSIEEIEEKMRKNKDLKKNRYYLNAIRIYGELKILKEGKKFDFDKFYKKIFLKIFLVRIICDDLNFAMKIFEVLNSTGLPLKNSDLIKNFLFIKIDNPKNQNSLNESWKKLISDIEDNEDKKKEDIEDILTIFLYARIGKNPKHNLFDEFTKYYKERKYENSNKFLEDFSEFTNKYLNFFNKKNKNMRKIYVLSHLRDNRFWKSILLGFIEKNKTIEEEKLIDILFKFFYMNYISGISVNRYKGLCFNILQKILNSEKEFTIQNIEEKFEEFNRKENVLETFKLKIISNIYGENWGKNLLVIVEDYLKIEADGIDDSEIHKINDRKLQIEHIYPQKLNEKYSKDEFLEENKDRLGNLSLLYGFKNKVCSNKIFEKKLEKYRNNKFKLTNGLTIDYKNNGIWNKEIFEKRQENLIILINEIFDIKS
jgi:uncharacterized protein with ParB-like and HNH nuclease domain